MGASGKAKQSHYAPPNSAKKAEAAAYAASPEGQAEAAQAAEKRAEEKRLEALRADVAKGLCVVDDADAYANTTRAKFADAKKTTKAASATKRREAAARRAAVKAATAGVDEPEVPAVAEGDVTGAIFE